MRGFGTLPIATSAIGGTLLYAGMFVLSVSVPVVIGASLVLAGAYGLAYLPPIFSKKKMAVVATGPHRIQVFSGGCKLCEETADIVEVGKCKDCRLEVLKVGEEKNGALVKQYNIISVPSIVIDGKIKVEWKPTFPWYCGDAFYAMLQARYPLKRS